MKKFTLVLTIAIICSFAVVRRKEEQDTEAFFQDAITRVMEDENIAYQVKDTASHIGNCDHFYRDQPVSASRLLNDAFDDVVFVDNGIETSWIDVANLETSYRSGILRSFSWN